MNSVFILSAAVLSLLSSQAIAGSWTKRPGSLGSAFIGVSAGSQPQEVYFAGGDNGIGAAVLKSEDHGTNFTKLSIQRAGILLAAGGSKTKSGSAVVNGLFGSQFTTDGTNFKNSLGGGGGQCVANFGESDYALVSQNAVKISTNGGFTFKKYKVSGIANQTNYPARYGAFPSSDVWYLSAGTWPNTENDENENIKMLTERHGVSTETGDLFFDFEQKEKTGTGPTQYYGAILKTEDGGTTWTKVFEMPANTAYFNQISCSTESHCVAVAEGHNSAHPGAYIYVTTDGGKTWDQTHAATAHGSGMTGCYVLDENEVWAMGASPHGIFGQADCLHSMDGGKTWTASSVTGVAGLFLDCFDKTSCYASAINSLQQSTLLMYQ